MMEMMDEKDIHKNHLINFNQDYSNQEPLLNLNNATLVGGWTNHFEKYARQIGFIFPK